MAHQWYEFGIAHGQEGLYQSANIVLANQHIYQYKHVKAQQNNS
ncbi:hypothetical protein [Shewanella algidipiscicola]|nr:hypothetical protein [Shewanella algidipiscicola]